MDYQKLQSLHSKSYCSTEHNCYVFYDALAYKQVKNILADGTFGCEFFSSTILREGAFQDCWSKDNTVIYEF